MNLIGWDYTGRNLGPEFHKDFYAMIDCLSNPSFINHESWGNSIQNRLTEPMKEKSSGAVRTVKKICSNFGLINDAAFSSNNEINSSNLLTERGELVFLATELEEEINDSDYQDDKKKELEFLIKSLYEEAYSEALKYFYFQNNDGSTLHPLRATLKALKKYQRLDKWEWYLLNTCIRHDDNEQEETDLEDHIFQYRGGNIEFTMDNVIEKQKGHQYTPQYFSYAGLINLVQRPEWVISDSQKHMEIKEEVLKEDFLIKLYGGVC